MDVSGKLLDILFRRIPPERMYDKLNKDALGLSAKHTPQKAFLRFAESSLSGYSQDEQSQFYLYLENETQKMANMLGAQPSVFLPLVWFGNHVLNAIDEEPTCKLEKVLEWREVYHILGQDAIVCASLAYNDLFRMGSCRSNFAWPATLRTDCTGLNAILAQGVAENHAHLNGSSQSFGISWCKLMNYPDASNVWIKEFGELLQSTFGRGVEDNILPIEKRVNLAVAARAILFMSLNRQDFSQRSSTSSSREEYQNDFNEDRQPFSGRTEYRKECCQKLDPAAYAYNIASMLRKYCDAAICLPDGSAMCLDYALGRDVLQPVVDSPYRLLAGERWFLYRCFRACFSNQFDSFECDLLYFYLQLKTAFRAEMIQVNGQVGFQNFSNYQDRKSSIWENHDGYWYEAYRMALNAPIQKENVISFESRLCPCNDSNRLRKKVEAYDHAKWFADQTDQPHSFEVKDRFKEVQMSGKLQAEPHFYVLHYPKQKDEDPRETSRFIPKCRHENFRRNVKVTTLAIDEALSQSDYLCSRVRGIDACSNEIVCRPEVFATAYRFLNKMQSTVKTYSHSLLGGPECKLSMTYHAGEDFYDIVDGLRAIDEAVIFLEMKRGSRIGHALALGIDPQTHYMTKSNCIILPKQNYLDNLVWLLYRGNDLGLSIKIETKAKLEITAYNLLRYIYGDAIQQNHWHITLSEYYASMKLRGDDPALYATMTFSEPSSFGCEYDRCGVSAKYTELRTLRSNAEIAGMYYLYHYGYDEKVKGAEPEAVHISCDYIAVVEQMQNLMQHDLEHKGMIIECNPSSNVLIGTFGDYGKHPLFRFNNDGLPTSKNERNPKLRVCVNTDDLGIFDTSISFEYALLYHALKEQKGEDGKTLYTEVDIEHYLNNIRTIGLRAAFPSIDKNEKPIYT